jgi:uncharacterized protein YndB with AHSA1/START domain
MTENSIELTAMIGASREETWEFLTIPRHLAAWFGSHIRLDARLGGRMEERWEQGGQTIVTTGIIDAFEHLGCSL